MEMRKNEVSEESKPYRDFQGEEREKFVWLQMYRKHPENYPDVTQEEVEKAVQFVEDSEKLRAKFEKMNILQFAKLAQYALSVRDEKGKFVQLNSQCQGDTYTFELIGKHSHVKIEAKDTPDLQDKCFARMLHAHYDIIELAENENFPSKEDRFIFDVRDVGFEILSKRLAHFRETGEIEPWEKYIMTAPEKEA